MKIQSIYKVLGNYSCLAEEYLWVADIDRDVNLAAVFNELVEKGILDEECTVLRPDDFYAYFGIKAHVTRSSTPPSDKSKKYIALFEYNGHGHFVGMKDGIVANNTLDHSECVQHGKITSYRIIDFLYKRYDDK